jgi:predicted transcriptional regulator
VERYPEPRPAYNTVSTLIRILEQKNFVSHTAYGKTHEYFPLISKDEYRKQSLNTMLSNYFSGSFRQLASFFAREENIDRKEMEDILKEMKKEYTGKTK